MISSGNLSKAGRDGGDLSMLERLTSGDSTPSPSDMTTEGGSQCAWDGERHVMRWVTKAFAGSECDTLGQRQTDSEGGRARRQILNKVWGNLRRGRKKEKGKGRPGVGIVTMGCRLAEAETEANRERKSEVATPPDGGL